MSSFASVDSATRQSQGDALTAEDIQQSATKASNETAEYAAMLGDDALILGQRLAWWISRAPEMEEDIALGNIALDLVGHARFFYSYAVTAWDKTEDELAFFRDEEEFRSARLMELENGDFAQTIARQLVASSFMLAQYQALTASKDTVISGIAAKAAKESEYHLDHAIQWMFRLGLGTDESKRRIQEGLKTVWPYIDELFEDLELHRKLADQGVAILPSSLRHEFDERMEKVLEVSQLESPNTKQAMSGHRTGCFSEQRGFILAEMQSLARKHPGATW